jgi:hypothetical protein
LKVAPPIMLDGFLPICEHLFGTHGSQNDMASLHGKTVLLTGASKGIGAAVPVERKLLVSVDFMQPHATEDRLSPAA